MWFQVLCYRWSSSSTVRSCHLCSMASNWTVFSSASLRAWALFPFLQRVPSAETARSHLGCHFRGELCSLGVSWWSRNIWPVPHSVTRNCRSRRTRMSSAYLSWSVQSYFQCEEHRAVLARGDTVVTPGSHDIRLEFSCFAHRTAVPLRGTAAAQPAG